MNDELENAGKNLGIFLKFFRRLSPNQTVIADAQLRELALHRSIPRGFNKKTGDQLAVTGERVRQLRKVNAEKAKRVLTYG